MNRVKVKPIIEKEDNKKSDNVKSLEQWYGYLQRNQSILVDLLYGQYKSTLYCPDEKCQNISTTFDPFLSISLPLTHIVDPYEVTCFFIFYDISITPIQLLFPFSSECTIMALRNKISKILNIPAFSFFIIKMDPYGLFDFIISSTNLLKVNNYAVSPNQKPFFLFQINPEIFYDVGINRLYSQSKISFKMRNYSSITRDLEDREEENKKFFKEDYEEDESNSTLEKEDTFYSKSKKDDSRIKINVDDNHGFDSDWLKLVIYLDRYKDDHNDVGKRERIIFPRILYININWTCERLHRYIFEYLYFIITKKKGDSYTLWNKYFLNLNTDNENDTYEYHKNNNYPYRVRIRNIALKDKNCYTCTEKNCHGCLLPYSSDIKVKDLLAKYPREEFPIDNTFFYLNDHQRRSHGKWNRDFSLDLTWLSYFKKEVYSLNDKKDYDFKIQKIDMMKTISIYDCFKNFVKLEKLEDMNEWYCPNCKNHKKAMKKMEIYRSPHVLIILLKRFKNLSKSEILVDFPLIGLDMSQFVISNDENQPLLYDLFAIANHYGNTGYGHYIAYAKSFNHQWYKFDDSNITPINQNELVTTYAYVLFYRRRNLENILHLEEIYKKSFINYSNQMSSVEYNLKTLNDLYNK